MIDLLPSHRTQKRARPAEAEGPQACAVEAPVRPDRERYLADELAKAARYIRALLPMPLSGAIETDWVFMPSAELGGDAFGYHWLDDEHFAIYLLDVCGHGIGAALHSVSVLNVLRAQALGDTDFRKPEAVLAALNEAFQMKRYNNMYFTIWYGVFNIHTRRLTYATGGHPPALLVGPGVEGLSIERLRTRGLLIGGVEGVAFPSASRIIPEGYSLYVFSDGVYEVRQEDGSIWGLDDYVDLLIDQLGRGHGHVDQVMDRINIIRDCLTCIDDSALLRIRFN